MQTVLGRVPENASCPVMPSNPFRRCFAGRGQKLDKKCANDLSVQVIAFPCLQTFPGTRQCARKGSMKQTFLQRNLPMSVNLEQTTNRTEDFGFFQEAYRPTCQ